MERRLAIATSLLKQYVMGVNVEWRDVEQAIKAMGSSQTVTSDFQHGSTNTKVRKAR